MKDEQLDDLKQFITATVSQSQELLRQELSGKMDGLQQEMHEGFASVGDTFAPAHDQLDNHEQRITKLESQAA